MKSVVELWVTCLTEAGDQFHVRTFRDRAYALSRVEDEGLSFLTIALPSFEKDLLQAISLGAIGSNHFVGFRRRGGLPAFLSGFLSRIFNQDGTLRSDSDPLLLRAVRQVLLFLSKIELPTSDSRQFAALRGYRQTDELLKSVSPDVLGDISVASRRILSSYFSEVEDRLWSGDWVPRHSSGAVATRESYNSRYSIATWTERLQSVFPWWEDLTFSLHDLIDSADEITVLTPDQEPPVRVTTVPKTMKGPRIIAMEPAWMQFVQQGIFHVMTEVLLRPRHTRLASLVSWMDQEPNRALARLGSVDGSYATLDLSEASDRVSLELVESMLASHPFLLECVKASRSQRALLPSGATISLNKFASMGSALCFPIESLVFLVLESLAFADSAGLAPSALRLSGLPKMRVYGDDLIVPSAVARYLVSRLESCGLKVNAQKSFTTGLFRESCGSDWFRGADVSVFKMRHPLPSTKRQASAFEQAISFHNRAYSAGWFAVASDIESRLNSVFRVPRVPFGARVPGLWTYDPVQVRTDPSLQRVSVRAMRFRKTKPQDLLTDYGALRKFFLPHVLREKNHLERDGRSQCVGMNTEWTVIPY